MAAGNRVIAYLRVSVVGDRAIRGRLESPELQLNAIKGWADSRGMIVTREVRDLNRSAWTLSRPGLQEALAIVEAGEADGIVVARSDRASRRTLDGLGLIDELQRLGGFIAAADGTIDTTDRIRTMATTMHFAFGQSELERFREQSAIIHRRAILEKGRHMGPAPFGYTRDGSGRLVPDPKRERWARWVFEQRADGAGWVSIARSLEAADVKLPSGAIITPNLLRRMIERRVYLGEAKHGNHSRPGAHPAIVDAGLFAAANRARPAVASAPSTERVHEESPLRGLLRCAGCRYVLKRLPAPVQLGGQRWACRTRITERGATHRCDAPALVRKLEGDGLMATVLARFLDLAGDVAAQRSDTSQEEARVARELEDAEALLDELSSVEVRRQLGADRWHTMTSDARAAVDEKTQALAVLRARSRSSAIAERGTIAETWDTMTAQEQGAALRSIVQTVMVVGDTGPIAERAFVLPVWEPVDVPARGVKNFRARPWAPGDN